MGIYKVKDRQGRRRYVVSKYWPNGSRRLRKYAPNYRSAQALQTRVESSILDGTWKQLKRELAGGNRTIWTVRSFYERFIEEYCKPRLRSLRRYSLSFKRLNAVLGNISLKEFQRKDLHRYVAQRKKQVKLATVNRAIAAISKLFCYALECGEIDTHPLVRFPKLKEPKKAFQPLTVQQFRDLVGLVRYLNTPHVFVNSRTGTRWVTPDKLLRRAAEKVGLKVGFPDLRRFLCCHWLMLGGGRENGAEVDGALGDQHDDAVCGVRQFACAPEHSGGTG